jgi:hypothetical protein
MNSGMDRGSDLGPRRDEADPVPNDDGPRICRSRLYDPDLENSRNGSGHGCRSKNFVFARRNRAPFLVWNLQFFTLPTGHGANLALVYRYGVIPWSRLPKQLVEIAGITSVSHGPACELERLPSAIASLVPDRPLSGVVAERKGKFQPDQSENRQSLEAAERRFRNR